jgi:hypothetical protein
VNPFISTLGTMGLVRGAVFLFSDSQQIPIEGSLPQGFLDFGIERFLGIHWLVWVPAALAVALTWMLEKTPYGRAGSAWPWAGDHRRRGRRPAQAPGLEWRFEEDLAHEEIAVRSGDSSWRFRSQRYAALPSWPLPQRFLGAARRLRPLASRRP